MNRIRIVSLILFICFAQIAAQNTEFESSSSSFETGSKEYVDLLIKKAQNEFNNGRINNINISLLNAIELYKTLPTFDSVQVAKYLLELANSALAVRQHEIAHLAISESNMYMGNRMHPFLLSVKIQELRIKTKYSTNYNKWESEVLELYESVQSLDQHYEDSLGISNSGDIYFIMSEFYHTKGLGKTKSTTFNRQAEVDFQFSNQTKHYYLDWIKMNARQAYFRGDIDECIKKLEQYQESLCQGEGIRGFFSFNGIDLDRQDNKTLDHLIEKFVWAIRMYIVEPDEDYLIFAEKCLGYIEGRLIKLLDHQKLDRLPRAVAGIFVPACMLYASKYKLYNRSSDFVKALNYADRAKSFFLSRNSSRQKTISNVELNPILVDSLYRAESEYFVLLNIQLSNSDLRALIMAESKYLNIKNSIMAESGKIDISFEGLKTFDELYFEKQFKMNPNQLFLHYSIFGDELICFYISKNERKILRKSSDVSIRLEIRKLLQKISSRKKDYEDELDELSSIFLDEEWNLEQFSSINIIPLGSVGFFPFELLHHKGQKLFSFTAINYCFSLMWQYTVANSYKRPKFETMLAFGSNSVDDESAFLAGYNVRSSPSIYLPFVDKEIEAISKHFKSTVLTDTLATRNNLLNVVQENFDILHLATHMIKSKDGQNSLHFTSYHHDEPISVHDLIKKRLEVDLVCLSACNTGVGGNGRDLGRLSPGKFFALAGVPNIAMSLWDVQDHATYEIMDHFYNYLHTSSRPVQSLNLAKQNYVAHNNESLLHPYYWAPMVIFSAGDMIPQSDIVKFPPWGIGVLAMILIVSMVFIIKK